MIDFEETLSSKFNENRFLERERDNIIEAMKECYNKALDLAAKNAEIDDVGDIDAEGNSVSCYEIDKQSILKLKEEL